MLYKLISRLYKLYCEPATGNVVEITFVDYCVHAIDNHELQPECCLLCCITVYFPYLLQENM